MRKLLLVMSALAITLVVNDDAHAFDVKNKFIISTLGGLAIPVGDFSSEDTTNVKAGGAKLGYKVGLAVEYGASEQLLIGGRFSYNRFNVERKAFGDRGEQDSINAHWSVVELFGVFAKYLFNSGRSTRPFARLGVFAGRADLRVHGNTSTYHFSNLSGVSPGLELGLGVTHAFSEHFSFSFEGQFNHLIVNVNEGYRDIDPGAASAGVAGPAGVRDPGGNIDWLAVNAVVSYGF